MDVDKIKELVELMKLNDLTELEILDGQTRIILKRGLGQSVAHVVTMPPTMAGFAPAMAPFAVPAPGSTENAGNAPEAEQEKLIEIKAPLVGTFYSAPSPTAEPFTKIGAAIDADTVVCIIEAMKVMNEIKAQVSGTIQKVLVTNGQAVEFGQVLFLVKPN
jgi:acetyl-CoA carboxylase biotin carboxyl carrier protein